MKRILHFVLGLAVLSIVAIPAFAAVKPLKNHAVKEKKVDNVEYRIFYEATQLSGSTYSLKAYFLWINYSAAQYRYTNVTSNTTSTLTTGPYTGASFTIPSGSNFVSLGNFISSGPFTYSFDINTVPSYQSSLMISHYFENIDYIRANFTQVL